MVPGYGWLYGLMLFGVKRSPHQRKSFCHLSVEMIGVVGEGVGRPDRCNNLILPVAIDICHQRGPGELRSFRRRDRERGGEATAAVPGDQAVRLLFNIDKMRHPILMQADNGAPLRRRVVREELGCCGVSVLSVGGEVISADQIEVVELIVTKDSRVNTLMERITRVSVGLGAVGGL